MNTEQTSKNIFMYNCLTFQDLNKKKTKTKKTTKQNKNSVVIQSIQKYLEFNVFI